MALRSALSLRRAGTPQGEPSHDCYGAAKSYSDALVDAKLLIRIAVRALGRGGNVASGMFNEAVALHARAAMIGTEALRCDSCTSLGSYGTRPGTSTPQHASKPVEIRDWSAAYGPSVTAGPPRG